MTRLVVRTTAMLLALPSSLGMAAPATPVLPASAVAAAGVLPPAPPPITAASTVTTLAVAALALAPGEFLWEDERSVGAVTITVSLPEQKLYAYRGDRLIAVSTVSTGKRGHATPTGRFPILEKRRTHFSNLYANAPMPFMQRLTWDGVALHAGRLPGYPASHGCVRLPHAFAERLFAITSRGAMVIVTDQRVAPAAVRPAPVPSTHEAALIDDA